MGLHVKHKQLYESLVKVFESLVHSKGRGSKAVMGMRQPPAYHCLFDTCLTVMRARLLKQRWAQAMYRRMA